MSVYGVNLMEFKTINIEIPTIKTKSYEALLASFVLFEYRENTIITDDELANKSLEEILYGDTEISNISIEDQLYIAA